MNKIAVYPGSFDPVTNGHLDIISRAAATFDKVIVAVLKNSAKHPVFTMQERVEMLRDVTKNMPHVEVDVFGGLLVDYMKQKGAEVIIKGLRAVSDFEYEFQMALMNRKLAPNIETLFMMTSDKYSYLSTSIVREIAKYGGELGELVPQEILDRIVHKFSQSETERWG